jgi:hypothetical protein
VERAAAASFNFIASSVAGHTDTPKKSKIYLVNHYIFVMIGSLKLRTAAVSAVC